MTSLLLRLLLAHVAYFTLLQPQTNVVSGTEDPFKQPVPEVGLNGQSVVDGVAMAVATVGVPVSVEFPLGATISGQAPTLRTFKSMVSSASLSEVVDHLCLLDQTFTWERHGRMLNVLPSSVVKDPSYLLNRRIESLSFQDVPDASAAVMKMVDELPGPREQLAVLQVGTSLNFARPWTVAMNDVSVREVMNEIAQQLGPSYGWQFSGARDFRIITFHEKLLPRPTRGEQERSTAPRGDH